MLVGYCPFKSVVSVVVFVTVVVVAAFLVVSADVVFSATDDGCGSTTTSDGIIALLKPGRLLVACYKRS